MGPSKLRSQDFQKFDLGNDFNVGIFPQSGKPLIKLIGGCELPHNCK
jgi:hypothetical protein